MSAIKQKFSYLLTAFMLLFATAAHSAELREVTVELQDDHYYLKSEAWLDASKEDIYRVLSDYDLYVQISSGFVESRNEEADSDGKPRFYTRMQGCVLLFCKSFERHGYLILEPHTDIVAIVDPEESDFDFSRESWELVSEGDGTVMIYNFEMDPGFWVPPVIGPYYIKRTLRRGGKDAIRRIEALAKALSPVD
ncbi:MAG: SRPBCC family protein [Gammaproteobacteria bacterium]|nr:SRPBCC family protein [Gammaproteobacteria bacterium]